MVQGIYTPRGQRPRRIHTDAVDEMTTSMMMTSKSRVQGSICPSFAVPAGARRGSPVVRAVAVFFVFVSKCPSVQVSKCPRSRRRRRRRGRRRRRTGTKKQEKVKGKGRGTETEREQKKKAKKPAKEQKIKKAGKGGGGRWVFYRSSIYLRRIWSPPPPRPPPPTTHRGTQPCRG